MSVWPYVNGGAGTLPNDRIKCCKICECNGFPHEPIVWHEVRQPNGQIVVEPRDYFSPRTKHLHKKRSKSTWNPI